VAIRKPLDPTVPLLDILTLLGEGNPGGLTVLAQLLQAEPEKFPLVLLTLECLNIRGSQIWVGYKDYAGQDLGRFVEAVLALEPDLIEAINRGTGYPDHYPHKAVLPT
jgi:hypothetical protein